MSRRSPTLRRAPRLGPDELIAPHITRLGRFRSINPTKARKLPGFSKVLGIVGWAVLVEESFRRARRAAKADASPDQPV
jgi:hypothetical protein